MSFSFKGTLWQVAAIGAAILATTAGSSATDESVKQYIADQLSKYSHYEKAATLAPSTIILVENSRIQSVRSLFRWIVDVENINDRYANLPTFITFEPLTQAGVPAYKIEWYGFGENGATDDVTFVRQDNFQRFWRVLAAGGGRFHTIHDVIDGQTSTMDFSFENGEPKTSIKTYQISDAFDLAALPFALAFKERTPGLLRKVAIKNSSKPDGFELADLAEIGPAVFVDEDGDEHAAFQYDFIRENGEHWDYYVSDQPPYWFGLTADFQDGHKTHIIMRDFEMLKTNVDREFRDFIGLPPVDN